ncbi:TRAP transporter small permease [Pseudodonghicola flavimaris]|uniref:TRAP transporter small permease protein n=1 Tax=Pseudodonghicola flavimaris TaxID=3050036 RepID=A0ABT7EXM5_9RHOB|nr:TRAP transporter small permease subunit [Pseudodonghicola flavimaris]MDK3017098.1 TRAP transporter small permease subunit [Pseudodonghicola flavimaris]
MKLLARALDRLSATLDRIALWGAVLAVMTMLFAAGWQVLARYVLDAPPVWTEELARRAMVWAGMLGASCAFRAASDPTLFPAMQAVRGPQGMLLALIRGAGVVAFALPVIWFSLFNARMDMARGFLGRSLSRQAEMLDVPMIWFTAAVPLAFVLILIHLAARLSLQATGQLPVATPAADPNS